MRRGAWLLGGLAAVLVLASLVRIVLVADAPSAGIREWVTAVASTLIGAWVASRRGRNAIGWLLLGIGVSAALSVFSLAFAAVHDVIAWLSQWVAWPPLGLVPLVLLLFPHGRLLSPRWRAALVVAVTGLLLPAVAIAVATVGAVDLLNQAGGSQGWRAALLQVAQVGVVIAAGAALAGLVSLVVRYRRAGTDERQQLKWLFAAGVLVLLAGILDAALALPGVAVAGAVAMPVAIGIAILRHRLYDIDLLLSRTLVYSLLSALLAGVYVTGVFVIGQLLTPANGESQLAVAGSTLAAATVFQPARRRIQGFVDRRFNRRRRDALALVHAFGARLRDQLDLDTLAAELVEVVERTVEPARVSLSLLPVRAARTAGSSPPRR